MSDLILLLNDRKIYNSRYRSRLIALLHERGYDLDNIGVYESTAQLPRLAIKLFFRRHGLVISSNLKSNAFNLLFCRSPKVVILNGMGRYRRSRRLRRVVQFLLSLRKNTFVIVQNYSDYRYLRRFSPATRMEWMPGSGGTTKIKGKAGAAVIVQRDPKIASVADSIKALLNRLEPRPDLSILGCEDLSQLDRLFSDIPFRAPGYVDSKDIFRHGDIFIQPMGYGEGFPHTLADAMVSGMIIYISDIEFLRYGLGRLGATREPLVAGWSRLVPSVELIAAVHTETITARIAEICEKLHQDI